MVSMISLQQWSPVNYWTEYVDSTPLLYSVQHRTGTPIPAPCQVLGIKLKGDRGYVKEGLIVNSDGFL